MESGNPGLQFHPLEVAAVNDLYLEEMPAPSRDFVLAAPDSSLEVRPQPPETFPRARRAASGRVRRVVACGFPDGLLRVSARVEPPQREGRTAVQEEPGA